MSNSISGRLTATSGITSIRRPFAPRRPHRLPVGFETWHSTSRNLVRYGLPEQDQDIRGPVHLSNSTNVRPTRARSDKQQSSCNSPPHVIMPLTKWTETIIDKIPLSQKGDRYPEVRKPQVMQSRYPLQRKLPQLPSHEASSQETLFSLKSSGCLGRLVIIKKAGSPSPPF